MFEKVNPAHPDKVADRIAGAMVDLAYRKNNQPKIAVEVLIGHGVCHIITERNMRAVPPVNWNALSVSRRYGSERTATTTSKSDSPSHAQTVKATPRSPTFSSTANTISPHVLF